MTIPRFVRYVLPALLVAASSFGQAPPANDDCAGAIQLFLGSNGSVAVPFTTVGATPSTTSDGCGPVRDVWFFFTAPTSGHYEVSIEPIQPSLLLPGLQTYATCGGTFEGAYYIGGPSACNGFSSFSDGRYMLAGETRLARIYVASGEPDAVFGLRFAESLIPYIAGGVNPHLPAGLPGASFTNVGHPPIGGDGVCVPTGADIGFRLLTPIAGIYTVSTCTPPGFAPGTAQDTVIRIYSYPSVTGGVATGLGLRACNDDSCGLLSSVSFSAGGGIDYSVFVVIGSYIGAAPGSFYVTVTEPPPTNDVCTNPLWLQSAIPSTGEGSTHAATPTPAAPSSACIPTTAPDVWFLWNSTATGLMQARIEPSGFDEYGIAGADLVSVRSGWDCANPNPPFSACGSVATFFAFSGDTYLIRVANSGSVAPGDFLLKIQPPPPSNDEPTGAVPLSTGDNPPTTDPAFTNIGATRSVGIGGCQSFPNDVFFSYVSTFTGALEIELTALGATPLQSAANAGSRLLEVFAQGGESGSSLTCVSAISLQPLVAHLDVFAGQALTIRVESQTSGTFGLRAAPRPLELRLSAPIGPGSLLIEDLGGVANHVYFNFFTLYAGAFPNGPWLGIDPTFTEIQLQISSGIAPFVGLLDGAGRAAFGPVVGLPPLTLYGVAVELDLFGYLQRVSPPTSFAIY